MILLIKLFQFQQLKIIFRFLSKCLSGENRDEGFYIWTGTGGNGKSKLIDLMSMCMEHYACNLPIALLTQNVKLLERLVQKWQ